MSRLRVDDTKACQGGRVAGMGHKIGGEGRRVRRPSGAGVTRAPLAGSTREGDGATPQEATVRPCQSTGAHISEAVGGDGGRDGAGTYYRPPPYPPPSLYYRAPSPLSIVCPESRL